MKKVTIWVLTAVVVLTFASSQSMAATGTRRTAPIEQNANAQKAAEILARIDEINALDKTKMPASEKRALRKEVRESKKQLQAVGGGVYVSAGALILIVILLIILL